MFDTYEIVRDVSKSLKGLEDYYIVFKESKKIYHVLDKNQLELLRKLNPSKRWFDNELQVLVENGYIVVTDIYQV